MRKTIFAVGVMMLTVIASDAQTSRTSVSAAEVNGTFRMSFTGKFKGSSNDIKVLALGGGKIRFAMDLIYPYTMRNGDLMANMGQMDAEASIDGDTALFKSDNGECTMKLIFTRPGTLKVEQTGTDADCGFGHNVMAGGTYRKISSKKPKFEEN